MSGYVYAIEAPNGQIKIGAAAKPRARLSAIKTKHGAECRIIHMVGPISNFGNAEREAQRVLNPFCVGGEWFSASADSIKAAIDAAVEATKGEAWPEHFGRPLIYAASLVKREFSLTREQMAKIECISLETGRSLSEIGRELIGIGLEHRGR